MRVAIIGTGHVGVVSAVTLAKVGHDVVATDIDEGKIAALNERRVPFFEPGTEELLVEGLDAGRLSFTTDLEAAVGEADVILLCVGTPPRLSGEANLVAVEGSVRAAAPFVTGRTLFVEKSTVPAGTFQRMRQLLRRARPDLIGELDVASNPEFLREGSAIQDALYPDRILVGTDGEWAREVMRELYAPFIDEGVPYFETDIPTAELAKHACNAFLALKISFANALARMCEKAGGDVVAVADVMGSDPRIGRAFLNAGMGYGGSCFPKDLVAFERLAASLGYDFGLLNEISRINEEAIDAVVTKIEEALWNLEDKRVALLGLAFKAGTDDIRFAPALALATKLLERGAKVVGYDPKAAENAAGAVPELQIAPEPYAAAEGADCVVVCTEWPEVVDADLERLRDCMRQPVVVDGRNLWDPAKVSAAGLSYYPMGRPALEGAAPIGN
jgi:UDPglucose 6-dehydrogenase